MPDIKERNAQQQVSSLFAILSREAVERSLTGLNVQRIYGNCIDISVDHEGDRENLRITSISSANPSAQWELSYSARPKRAEERFPQKSREEEPLSNPAYRRLREGVRYFLPMNLDMSVTFSAVNGSETQAEEVARYFIKSS